MKELWIRYDEGWNYYDCKPTYEILELDKPIDGCVVNLTAEEFERYEKHLAEVNYWYDYFESKCKVKK